MPPNRSERTRFVADAMLGSLARKLRVFGFDASYYRSGDDRGLLEIAKKEGRVILTSDRGLAVAAALKQADVILLTGRSDGSRISAMAIGCREMGLSLLRGDPLCSLCGGELAPLRRVEASGKVPPGVENRHRVFYRCRRCGKYYWRGSHWKKLRSLARRLGK